MRTEEIALTGLVGGDLEGSIAATGVTAATAGKSAALVRKLVAPGRPRADDRFVLVVQYRPKARSPRAEARLLYAELRRPGEPPHRIVADQDAKVPLGAPMVAARSPRFAPAFPVRGRITSGFGWRRHPILRGLRLHRGIDIAAPSGSVVRAAGSGQVVWTGWNGGYGNQVRVRHPGGTISSYSHLRAIAVRAGSAVAQGQPIGRVGATGLATGPHLHYELVRGGVPFEPKAAMLTDEGGPQTAATAAEREYRRLRSLPRFSSIADWRARRGRAQPE